MASICRWIIVLLTVSVGMATHKTQTGRSIESQLRDEFHTVLTHAASSARRLHSRQRHKANQMQTALTDPFSVIQSLSSSNLAIKTLSFRANVVAKALKRVQKRYQLNKDEINRIARSGKFKLFGSRRTVAPDTDHSNTEIRDVMQCPFPNYHCGNANEKYRTYDGSCNNRLEPLFGRSNIPLNRLLNADYGNGIDSLRKAKSGKDLPSARKVSNTILTDRNLENTDLTNMHMIFGQFIDHDMDKVPISKMVDSKQKLKDLQCGSDGCSVPKYEEACAPIKVAPDDTIFGGKKECVKFVRSEGSPDLHCTMGVRQQANQITAFLDASLIYGNDKKEANALRNNTGTNLQFLRFANHPFDGSKKYLLPYKDVPACRDVNDEIRCFQAGDGRVNENVGLIALHTIFLREHNRLAEELVKINSHWDAERLYQESRRIMGAILSEITFKEYNPTVLGQSFMNSFQLNLKRGYYYGYKPRVDAGVLTEFATAAFRFGHSQIPPTMKRVNKHYKLIDEMPLSKLLRRPGAVYDLKNGGADALLLGMIDQQAMNTDAHFTIEVSSRMFAEMPPKGLGLDLPAINTQRGRDHGIKGYNEYRELCGSGRAWSFNDLRRDISYSNIQKLRQVYEHVDDIDLFVGGILERHVSGGVVGRVFACILGNQFSITRIGDRFWYENAPGISPNPFKKDQLAEIRKVTLARIMCDNMDDVETIQPRVMETAGRRFNRISNYFVRYGRNNSRVHCSRIPSINLEKWREFPEEPVYADRPYISRPAQNTRWYYLFGHRYAPFHGYGPYWRQY